MIKNIYIVIGSIVLFAGLGVITVHEEIFLPNTEARRLLTKGKLLMEQESAQEMKNAVEIFTTVASHFPDTKQAKSALYHLAETYERLGNIDVAIGKYRRLLGLELDNDMADRVKFKIARLQLSRYNSEEGFNSLMNLLSRKTDYTLRSDIYTEIARYHSRQKSYKKAQVNYEIALTEYSKNVDANLELADAYFYQGRYSEALNYYKKFFRIFIDRNAREERITKKFLNRIYDRAREVFTKGKLSESSGYFRFLYEKFPNTIYAENSLYYHGNIYYQNRSYQNAVSMFKKVIEQSPADKDENAYIKTGQSFFQMNEFQKSAVIFARVQDIFPKGQYRKVAKEWESESRRALQESYQLNQNQQNDDNKSVSESKSTEKHTQTLEKGSSSLEYNKIDEPVLDEEKVVP